jgi:hypothetical protein
MLLLLSFWSLLLLASLCSLSPFWARAVVFAWPLLRGGLAALCLVSQLPVWTRGAFLRRLGQLRCECELDSVPLRVFHPNSHVHSPLPLRSRHRETLRLSVVNLAPRWEGGMVGVRNERKIICQLRQFGPPLYGPPDRRPPADSSHGSYERRNILQDF